MAGPTFHLLLFLTAFLYANGGEWFFHRYVLHGLGKKRGSFFNYHLHDHHRVCSEMGMRDPGYNVFPRSWNAQAKELAVLTLILIVHSPLFFIIPAFAAAFYLSIFLYYYRHRKAHLDTGWALKHLRWHYDHHMNNHPLQANWCITWPWFDLLMGTREKNSPTPSGDDLH